MSDIWITMIGNLGFPIVISFYLLARLEKSFNQLERIVGDLINEIQKR